MKLFNGSHLLVLSCLLGTSMAGPLDGRHSGKKQEAAVHPNEELSELIRRTQDLAEQAQSELKRSREQNEKLQQMLEQALKEMSQIRVELNDLRSGRAAGQGSAAPAGSEAAASKPSESGTALAARLTGMEDQIQINAAQIKEQAQTKVESDSRFRVRLFGTILNNTYFNTSDTSEEAVPRIAPPGSARVANGGNNFGSTLRQTSFGFAMTGPKLGEARLSADVDFDFYGGAPGVYGADVLGALRMRTASARLDGTRTSLAIGLMAPMISPLSPTSLAAVYYPALGDSGNLWQWRPQITLERRARLDEQNSLVLQGGLMMPFGETFYGKGLEGKPGYESRVAFDRQLDADRRLEFGAGGYYHPQQFGFGRTVNSYALTGDWRIPLHDRLELSGEAYYGRSITLSEQSGGDISGIFAFSGPIDTPATTFRGIHSIGGWTQLRVEASPKLDFNLAFGAADPRNRDVFAGLYRTTTKLRNQTLSVNSIYRFRSNFLLSLEYRRLWTSYPDTRTTNGHINLALGYAF
jgi:hypothetical protein